MAENLHKKRERAENGYGAGFGGSGRDTLFLREGGAVLGKRLFFWRDGSTKKWEHL